MHRDNKYITIKLEKDDGGYVEAFTEINHCHSAAGVFYDYLEMLIESSQYKNIVCTLKDKI